MKYPIRSKEGESISTTDEAAIPLHGIKDIFDLSSAEEQIELCNKLGVKCLNNSVSISFKECGKAYEAPNEDRNRLTEHETEHSFDLTFKTEKDETIFPLKLSINLKECHNQSCINFLGEIRFFNSENEEIEVPLTGRGTAALEGRIDDVHAGLCSNGYCAGFQNRVAILSSILACLKITRDDIEILRAHLLKVCNKYFGIEDLLSYTIDKAFNLTQDSYFNYMKSLYDNKEDIPIMLLHFIEFGEPHPLYFYELSLLLSEEEIDSELKEISSNSRGPDQKQISSKVREIINKFILLDDIYLIKPYPGNLIINTDSLQLNIYDIAKEFNSNSVEKCLMVLEKLGLTVNENSVSLVLVIRGKKIIHSENQIKMNETETEETIELNFKRKSTTLDSLMKMKIYLDIDPIDYVNFFGKIEIKNSFFKTLIIPLPGRGTVELEGRLNDKHMGFCMGNECASFLQKVAIIYCSLILLDVDLNDLSMFETKIKILNDQYHGRHSLINYIFKIIKGEENDTYFKYMKKIHMDYSTMPLVLKTILTYNRLPSKFYEDLISKFTEEELVREEERFQKINYLGFISRTMRQASSFIKNFDIF